MLLQKTILLLILAIVWVMVIFNRKLKRTIRENEKQFKPGGRRHLNWGQQDCSCGTPRDKWKALAMNRPDNTVLLVCPECQALWEEQMALYGNDWRPVDEAYARETYNYNPQPQEDMT